MLPWFLLLVRVYAILAWWLTTAAGSVGAAAVGLVNGFNTSVEGCVENAGRCASWLQHGNNAAQLTEAGYNASQLQQQLLVTAEALGTVNRQSTVQQ